MAYPTDANVGLSELLEGLTTQPVDVKRIVEGAYDLLGFGLHVFLNPDPVKVAAFKDALDKLQVHQATIMGLPVWVTLLINTLLPLLLQLLKNQPQPEPHTLP